jgi:hypothetical protein
MGLQHIGNRDRAALLDLCKLMLKKIALRRPLNPTAAVGKQSQPTIIDDGVMSIGLLYDSLAGAAKLRRKILQLGKTVFHGQHRLGVVDVNARLEGQRGNCRGKHIDQTEGRMIRQQMAAALVAELARAERSFLER